MWIGRLVFFTILFFGTWVVLRELWPSFASWRRAVAFAAVSGAVSSLWFVDSVRFVAAVWMVATLMVFVGGGAFVLVRQAVWRVAEWRATPESIDASRRRLLTNAGRAVPVAALATSSVGVAEGLTSFTVKREEIRVKGLAPGLDGFRIGQITDVHVGAFVDPSYVVRAVDAMNREGVDLQVMTGDLIDDMTQVDATMDALARTEARHGLFAVMGNHEYFRGAREVLAGYERVAKRGGRVRLLVDENAVVDHAGTPLRIVGVDFPMGLPGQRDALMRTSAESAFRGCAADETILCLSHHPDFFPHAAERGAALTLAGHTHGGQLALGPFALGSLVFRYALGRYRQGDRHHLYVSGGTGHWLPFRVGVPAEVTVLTLRSA